MREGVAAQGDMEMVILELLESSFDHTQHQGGCMILKGGTRHRFTYF